MSRLPSTQYAIQLTAANRLVMNKSKAVPHPGPHQLLCQVEAVGLCFSDLKLLKQFSSHVRKGQVTGGIGKEVLAQISSYVPDELPTVPGHEAVVRVVAVGEGVKESRLGRRYLVQTDYRWLPTAGSNAAFGYNFEGALQEYTLMDQRVITSPDGRSMLLPAPENLSSAAVALVEPWACVEDAYASSTVRSLDGSHMLIVEDLPLTDDVFPRLFRDFGMPAELTMVSGSQNPAPVRVDQKLDDVGKLGDRRFSDIIYAGTNSRTVELLFSSLSPGGLLNVVTCGRGIGTPAKLAIGRVHYGGMRLVGTETSDPGDSMRHIPQNGQVKAGGRLCIVGAGGPMGVMHVVRNLCRGARSRPGQIIAVDVDSRRLKALRCIAGSLAQANGVDFAACEPFEGDRSGQFDYVVLCSPQGRLVSAAIGMAARRGIINIFAGISVDQTVDIDIDAYIEKKLYFIGTSGSDLGDMNRVLSQLRCGSIDTNISVVAVSGLAGASLGMEAVESRDMSGKIVVYPACRELPLVSLEEMNSRIPDVGHLLGRPPDAVWNLPAEKKLLELFARG